MLVYNSSMSLLAPPYLAPLELPGPQKICWITELPATTAPVSPPFQSTLCFLYERVQHTLQAPWYKDVIQAVKLSRNNFPWNRSNETIPQLSIKPITLATRIPKVILLINFALQKLAQLCPYRHLPLHVPPTTEMTWSFKEKVRILCHHSSILVKRVWSSPRNCWFSSSLFGLCAHRNKRETRCKSKVSSFPLWWLFIRHVEDGFASGTDAMFATPPYFKHERW